MNITIVTGSLGAGKTTFILNLVKQLPRDLKLMWLKNEYGDVNIDSEVAKLSNIQTQEILNGCLCCVLIGKLSDAVEEISKNYKPDRLIIETAGTAYPHPIIHELSNSNHKIDGLINIVDSLNFEEFKDKSVYARKQAELFDLIVINKWERVKKEDFEKVEDEIYDLYPNIPKVKSLKGFVDKEFILNLDTPRKDMDFDVKHIHEEYEIFTESNIKKNFKLDEIGQFLENLGPKEFIRIKGILETDEGYVILNYVLGKFTIEKLEGYEGKSKILFISKNLTDLRKGLIKNFLGQ